MKRRDFLVAGGAAFGSLVLTGCLGADHAATAAEGRLMPTGDVERLGWHGFLSRWNDQALAIVRESGLDLDEPMARFADTGSLWRPPAGEAEIARRENELGLAFPASLRAFYLESDGWRATVGRDFRIHPLARIAWLPDADPQFLRAWRNPRWGLPEIGPEYDHFGPYQDPVRFRSGHLRYSLTLSSTTDDAPAYLLNSARQTAGDELEVWDLDFRLPGAYRYRSFAELMEVLYQEEIDMLTYFADPAPGEPTEDDGLSGHSR